MPVTERENHLVQELFAAMQMGMAGEERMMSLFAEDATLIEPFADGEPQKHDGRNKIRERFVELWSGEGPHDLKLTINQMDSEGGRVRVDWSCESAAFKTPMLGEDFFTIKDGLIKEVEFVVTTWPEFQEGVHA